MELALGLATSGTLSIGVVYWILMILWLVFGFWIYWPLATNGRPFGGHLFMWFLLFLLGVAVFGFPIAGL